MDCQKTGALIAALRKEKGYTQLQLAQKLHITDKTVSKWECGTGCPDVSVLPQISALLGVSVEQLLAGVLDSKEAVGGNMKKNVYYVCSVCGNVIVAHSGIDAACCGRRMAAQTPQVPVAAHKLTLETVEDEVYVTGLHPMAKKHYLSFIAFAAGERLLFYKQYPEWNVQLRLHRPCHGKLVYYCTKHGLFAQNI